MQHNLPLDAVDSRTVLTGHAAVVGPAGIFVALWGNVWMSGPLNGQAYGLDSLVRVAGTLVAAAGMAAFALGRVADPSDRRRCLGWFLAAHTFVLVIAWAQVYAIWDFHTVGGVFLAVGMAWAWLFAGWTRDAGDPPPFKHYLLRLFGEPAPAPRELKRSEYERQMRQAGAQEERHRLARDLHDAVKQQIFAIQTAAATAETRFSSDPDGARAALAQVRDAARDSMAEMDAMLDQLRAAPIENAGLVAALKQQCEAVRLRIGATVACEIGTLPPAEALPPGVHLALLRAAQEALSNVARHARATDVRVTLGARGSRIELTVTDNGSGYDPAVVRAGLGLYSIKARAVELGGEAHLSSRAGEGTTVFVTVPFAAGEPKDYRRRALWTIGAAALGIWLTVSGRQGYMAIFLVFILFDVTRYVLAWRRARRMREHLP